VRQEPNRLEVALVEGRVRLGSADRNSRSKPAVLVPGDVATATPSTLFVTKQSAKSLNNDLAWRRHLLVFDHATLADAASEFNRYNRQKIVIADPAVAQLMIDGTFRTNGVAAFVDVAQEALKLRVENDGDQILISR
jgi:transmembrane sensor